MMVPKENMSKKQSELVKIVNIKKYEKIERKNLVLVIGC